MIVRLAAPRTICSCAPNCRTVTAAESLMLTDPPRMPPRDRTTAVSTAVPRARRVTRREVTEGAAVTRTFLPTATSVASESTSNVGAPLVTSVSTGCPRKSKGAALRLSTLPLALSWMAARLSRHCAICCLTVTTIATESKSDLAHTVSRPFATDTRRPVPSTVAIALFVLRQVNPGVAIVSGAPNARVPSAIAPSCVVSSSAENTAVERVVTTESVMPRTRIESVGATPPVFTPACRIASTQTPDAGVRRSTLRLVPLVEIASGSRDNRTYDGFWTGMLLTVAVIGMAASW